MLASLLVCALLVLLPGGVSRTQAAPTSQSDPNAILLTDHVPDPHQDGVVYFPQTGHTLRGPFLRYWQQHGGLAQFGYPLTEEFFEPSGSDNAPLQVQYFERNRFEYHPENAGTPHEVLLGTLGREFHVQNPPAPRRSDALYFPETGHNVSGKFREYWEAHGGLAVHGYPITEPAMERSPTDGKDYMVQWFERSRFELHPENAGSEHEVLLGLLGRQLSEKNGYPYGWYPPYGRAADWSWVAGTFFPDPRMCPDCGCDTVRYVQGAQRADDRRAAVEPLGMEWANAKALHQVTVSLLGFPVVIFGHPPGPGEPTASCAAPGYVVSKVQPNPPQAGSTPGNRQLIARAIQSKPVSSGGLVVYVRNTRPNPAPYDPENALFGYDLYEKREFLVSDTPANKANLATDGKHIVWTESISDDVQQVYAFELSTGAIIQVLTATMEAEPYLYTTMLHDGVLYYRDDTPGHTGLFARTLATNDERLVSEHGFWPVADGNTLVWEEHRSPNPSEAWSLHVLRLDGSITDRVIVDSWKWFSGYDVSGDNVVYGFGQQSAPLDIYLYNVRDGTTRLIGKEGIQPHINGNKVAWTAGGIRMVHGGEIGTLVEVYDLNTGVTSTAAEKSEGGPQAIDVLDGNLLLYIAAAPESEERPVTNLYVRSLGR